MLKKTITYTDYDDIERTETFYFNLSEAELTKMQLEVPGGLDGMLQKMIDTKDVPGVTKVFDEIIKRAYGEKSPDGKYFRKSNEISENFMSTEAYSVLYMELLSNPNELANFINGLLPARIRAEVEKETKARLAQEGITATPAVVE